MRRRIYEWRASPDGGGPDGGYCGVRVERWKLVKGVWELWDSHFARFDNTSQGFDRARLTARALNKQYWPD